MTPVPSRLSWFRRPWVPETVVLFAILWQEAIRLELRTGHRTLPLPAWITQFYYFQFGDFVNGYLNAFLADGLTDLFIRWRKLSDERAAPSERTRAVVAAVFSMLVIIGVELVPSAFNQPDAGDIPAGIAGALVYLAVRTTALKPR